MASKTRDRLIDVARQLFLYKGVENTTIGDIASASDKGRRTIYTYFKNKIDLYNAVIEKESDKMVEALREISQSEDTAVNKLKRFFHTRFSQTKIGSQAAPSLLSLLTFDYRRTELIRKKAYEKEEALLLGILDDGIATGEFDADRCLLMRRFLYKLLHAIDTLTMHDEFTPVEPQHSHAFVEFLTRGVQK